MSGGVDPHLPSLTPWGVALACLFSSWLLISVVHQFSTRAGKAVRRHNALGLIPGWTFFAPNPGTIDYRFVYRDGTDQEFSPWQEIEWCRPRACGHAFWHPDRHRTKLVLDYINALVITIKEIDKMDLPENDGRLSLLVSVPYLALLNIAMTMPRVHGGQFRQFALIEQSPGRSEQSPRVILCSGPHPFEESLKRLSKAELGDDLA
jgi:hypothetical protein